ncbi:LlaJI family restriction endonuclease [Bacillus paranthracis]|uniref:LlaJI family restriction endonuclease n=1 Tax=Bacillus cereus group TaxID=86661 RepID=UPI000BF79C62|nr:MULTISPECIES: LlaJI family restriction endonuclease [Bacillus cereus group]MDA1510783.1 LlaJI family restriction endonuclease [Bacillus cereus group sp. TH36-2LC]MDA1893391.1 LlaJI family restriction endonuclease [Bacillus cereus group sp. BY11-1LC]MDA1901823.1 LlaJI family restriction endonuclease [Bacillus cereus group sp. BcHK20]NOP82398.1 LlaJI family restriction endonuclease [Bacillus paranthracis]PFU35550.1 hypothetical protein COK69_07215 [Bacillus cereus]
MNKLYFFVDYEWTKAISEIPGIFYERGLCEKNKNGQIRFKVTGIIDYQNDTYVIYPKGMRVSDKSHQRKKNANLIYKVLHKYSRTNIIDDRENDWLGSNDDIRMLELVQWFTEDYKQHGIIRIKRRVNQINGGGRIEWSKTISRKLPIVNEDDLIYLDLITSKNNFVNNEDLTLIHCLILKEISERFGWLFDFKFDLPLEIPNYNTKYIIYVLQKLLNVTYVEREIHLLKRMLIYWKRKTKTVGTEHLTIVATPFFHNVWERMCADFMKDMSDLHTLVPNPYWMFENTKVLTKQIPDILIQFNGSLIVIDAKYYRIKAGIDKLPGWGDIVKQLFYALSLKDKFPLIYNAFLFPTQYGSGIEYLGYSSVDEKEEMFGRIFAFGLDVQKVMEFYIGAMSMDESNDLRDALVNQLMKLNTELVS